MCLSDTTNLKEKKNLLTICIFYIELIKAVNNAYKLVKISPKNPVILEHLSY